MRSRRNTLPAEAAGFVARAGAFSGSLTDLAAALRAGTVQPGEVPLLQLTREVLRWTEAQRTGGEDWPAEVLPALAQVIALKARFLLPQPEADDPWDDPVEDVASSLEALAELDTLVRFLAQRRDERAQLIAARPLDLGLARKLRRKPASLGKLLQAAQRAVREVEVPLLARERLSLSDALGALRAFGKRLRHFSFWGVPAAGWGERTTYFAALLEGIKEGSLDAQQSAVYGDIEIRQKPASGAPAEG
ncbi:segregation/condensation protein A [Deinococcus lacus]|uniref:Segregation/condensation protein A n=1 Tax=Deinococcus lacus TaxID=392561 RepID=A0ABW1YAX2_9DEIO